MNRSMNEEIITYLTVFLAPIAFLFILAYFTSLSTRRYCAYGFLASLLKGKEAKRITEEHIIEALRKKSLDEALEAIGATELGAYISERAALIKTYDDVENMVYEYLSKDYMFIKTYLPKDSLKLYDVFIEKFDLFNIKQVIRRLASKSLHKVNFVPLGKIFESNMLSKLEEATSIDDVVNVVRQAGLYDYSVIIEEMQAKITSEHESFKARMILEKKLDEEYFSKLLKIALKLRGREQLLPAIGSLIDLNIVNAAVRAVASGKPQGILEIIPEVYYVLTKDNVKSFLDARTLEKLSEKLEYTPYSEIGRRIVDIYKTTKDPLLVEKTILDYSLSKIKENISTAMHTPAVLLHYFLIKEKELRLTLLLFRIFFQKIPYEKYLPYFKPGSA